MAPLLPLIAIASAGEVETSQEAERESRKEALPQSPTDHFLKDPIRNPVPEGYRALLSLSSSLLGGVALKRALKENYRWDHLLLVPIFSFLFSAFFNFIGGKTDTKSLQTGRVGNIALSTGLGLRIVWGLEKYSTRVPFFGALVGKTLMRESPYLAVRIFGAIGLFGGRVLRAASYVTMVDMTGAAIYDLSRENDSETLLTERARQLAKEKGVTEWLGGNRYLGAITNGFTDSTRMLYGRAIVGTNGEVEKTKQELIEGTKLFVDWAVDVLATETAKEILSPSYEGKILDWKYLPEKSEKRVQFPWEKIEKRVQEQYKQAEADLSGRGQMIQGVYDNLTYTGSFIPYPYGVSPYHSKVQATASDVAQLISSDGSLNTYSNLQLVKLSWAGLQRKMRRIGMEIASISPIDPENQQWFTQEELKTFGGTAGSKEEDEELKLQYQAYQEAIKRMEPTLESLKSLEVKPNG